MVGNVLFLYDQRLLPLALVTFLSQATKFTDQPLITDFIPAWQTSNNWQYFIKNNNNNNNKKHLNQLLEIYM